jgi:hypothetical protein
MRALALLPLALGSAYCGAGWAAANEGSSPSLRVAGSASFASETRALADGFEVSATLGDEVGRPLARAEVRVQLASPAGALRRCAEPARGEGANVLTLTTDGAGRACVVASGLSEGSLEFSYDDPRGYFERATRSVALPDSASNAFEVGFDPPLSVLSLDQPLQRIGLLARARHGFPLPEAAELVLSLVADASERELSRVALDGFGETHTLSVVSASCGGPGPARLVARLRTRAAFEQAIASATVLRTATVTLQVGPAAQAGVEAGESLLVRVTSVLGPVKSGVVEAHSAGRSIAAAKVEGGLATLAFPTAPARLLGESVSLHYFGGGSGWLPGQPLELTVKPPGRSYGRYALWIAAAVLAALAVVLGWRRPPRPLPSPVALPPRSRASLEVLETFGAGGGYRGLIRDAHDGVPISPAALAFITPGPQSRVLLQVRASADGSFAVDNAAFPAGTVLEVTAPFHATLSAALPGPGLLELSLVARRRALLDRLVRWAERHGKPWSRLAGEPTPAQVVATASQESEQHVESWARALEHLAYGPNPPDAASEQAAGVTEEPKTLRERGID